ncbi:hypothetical protein [uncultured Nostoc sp.]|uniref:hypothetical protein n=1 Tax=uncultured Nostoc sp. TaxID=340711 RepID=UPI0035CBD93B
MPLCPSAFQTCEKCGLRTLFAVCLFSACRIRESSTLLTQDIYTQKGIVRPRLIIRKSNTKGKLATRSIPVID